MGQRRDLLYRANPGPRPRTRIVAIGSADGIDAELLEATFVSCISGAQARVLVVVEETHEHTSNDGHCGRRHDDDAGSGVTTMSAA